MIHWPAEQRTHPGQRGQFWLHPSQWLPTSWHHHKQTHLTTLCQAAIHHPQPWHQKLPSGQHPYHTGIQDIHWGWTLVRSQWGTLFTRGDEHSHGVVAYNQGIHGCSLQEAGFGYWGCLPWEWGSDHWSHFGSKGPVHGHSSRSWDHMCYHYLGGGDCLCGSCPHPATSSQGQYGGPRKEGHWGGEKTANLS